VSIVRNWKWVGWVDVSDPVDEGVGVGGLDGVSSGEKDISLAGDSGSGA
jgi:hypothetical protein